MSYYRDVYLRKLNYNGTNRQERILGLKAKQFEESFLQKSIYKVNFLVDYIEWEGALQPYKEDEKITIYHLLVPLDKELSTGKILIINDKKWLVTFSDDSLDKGYNKYRVHLLNRTLTWWTEDKEEVETPIHLCGKMDNEISDIFKKLTGNPSFREATNPLYIVMAYDSDLKQDYYTRVDQSARPFIVSGFDCETVPGVCYMTLDITMERDEDSEFASPSSFWGGS